MINIELLTQADELIKNYNINPSGHTIEAIEKLLEEHLKSNPYDTQAWFKLAFVVYQIHDDLKAKECLEQILKYEPDNGYALVVIAYIADYYPYIDDALFERLSAFRSNDAHMMSMIEYMKSKYYFNKNDELEEKALRESIRYCDKYVLNHAALAEALRGKKSDLDTISSSLLNALYNIDTVYDLSFEYTFELQEFLNRYITGTSLYNTTYKQTVAFLRTVTRELAG